MEDRGHGGQPSPHPQGPKGGRRHVDLPDAWQSPQAADHNQNQRVSLNGRSLKNLDDAIDMAIITGNDKALHPRLQHLRFGIGHQKITGNGQR